MRKLIIAVGFLCVLAGCASPARVGAMTAETTQATLIQAGSPLSHSIEVGTISGGEKTNPLWTSQVGNPEFEQALTQSLQVNTMLANGSGKYRLDANLENLAQPFGGFDMTVTSRVRYKLTDKATGKLAFEQAIEASHTATVGDAFAGYERLRLANEGSIKQNISMFLDALVQAFKAKPASTTPAPTS